ncbi:Uncharacterised protein [Legionella wadsworthii]|uniref:Uncharacterized protein n=1 Tax=Legionella wadsworthii TaxID=28088 RepID=A0A378LVH2_9GAMM|nr:hypothetical protein [Legionella wadsworthii]STY29839.1 Uncharacterised protein [Legionella wadsworthii]
MDKNKSLNNFYHETFKKWLKGKCSSQAQSVSNVFEDEHLRAQYDEQSELFIIGNKEFSRSTVADSINNEEEFNLLIVEMIEGLPINNNFEGHP